MFNHPVWERYIAPLPEELSRPNSVTNLNGHCKAELKTKVCATSPTTEQACYLCDVDRIGEMLDAADGKGDGAMLLHRR